ncbi:MAG: PKD domain-containing protein [Deltaproteobacteria bacterium]|nr:PKD domain-containing protein [Deltaproteobacteria bacterium]
MQTRKLLTLLCLVWQCLLFGVVGVYAAPKPLSVEEIEYLLKEGVTPRRVAAIVEEQGVGFDTVTAEMRRRLTQAGADPGVIQAVERMALARKKTTKTPTSTSQERPPQTEQPPQIGQRSPDEGTVVIPSGESRNFSAVASDPNNEELSYAWSVDSKQAAQGDHFTFTAKEEGVHRITLEVTNRKRLKAETTWTVQVHPVSAALREVMFTPHQDHCSLFLHQSRFFAVQVEVPGVAEPSLRYEWTVNGQSVPGREVFEFKDQPLGLYEILVAVTPSSGVPLQHRWTVDVHDVEESDNIGPVWLPRIEIFDMKDIVTSSDQPVVIVTGKVRNLDKVRSADNVVVWVSTRDQGEKLLSRRIAVPTPQPLAPDRVGTFQVLMPNLASAAGFRYEVLNRSPEDEEHKKVEEKLIRRAQAAQQRKQWTEAEALLRTARKVYPPDQEIVEKLLQEVTAARQGSERPTGTGGGVIEAK